MAIKEVFPNPTVKQVIFQIRFPNLFSMEKFAGDYQTKIIGKFSDSELIIENQFLVGHTLTNRVDEIPQEAMNPTRKIWRFTTSEKVILDLCSDSLTITSNVHKTYNNPGGDIRFRETIQFALDNFLDVVKIPKINRLGMRYIDECPMPKQINKTQFGKYYNTTFPLSRFKLQDALEMSFKARVKKGDFFLVYREYIKHIEGVLKLILDFDGYAENIISTEYLKKADKIHEFISNEFEKTIKLPVYTHMKKTKKT